MRRARFEDLHDWENIQEEHNKGKPFTELSKDYHISNHTLSKAVKLGILIRRVGLSDYSRLKMSISYKQWLSNNPDKHPWKNSNKHISQPCEKVKEYLLTKCIPFVGEYKPNIFGRHFSIDIAMPDKMIALEINGNQHYEKDGTLKPYYQDRHNLLENNCWTVYEIRCKACFKLDKLDEFFELLKKSDNKVEFDYFTYIPKNKIENKCKCGKNINPESMCCRDCHYKREIGSKHKIEWPPKEIFEIILWERPTSHIAKELGTSDNMVAIYVKRLGLTKPPRGYWTKNKQK